MKEKNKKENISFPGCHARNNPLSQNFVGIK